MGLDVSGFCVLGKSVKKILKAALYTQPTKVLRTVTESVKFGGLALQVVIA
jgi:hypothetical protein